MKNNFLVAILLYSSFGSYNLDGTPPVVDQTKTNARKLVQVFFVRDIQNDFASGQISRKDRKRMREDIMHDQDCPYRIDEVNQRSMSLLLYYQAKRYANQNLRVQDN